MTTPHLIYTIGYATWQPEQIKAEVERLGALLWDIRMSPRSRRPEWQGSALRALLGPRYVHMAALGNKNYQGDGPIELSAPQAAVGPALSVLGRQPLVLLCGCRDYWNCHREAAADFLAEQINTDVTHLDPPKKPKAAPAPATSPDGYYPLPVGKEPMKCRSCGASVIWAKTAAGKSIPLDLGHVRGSGAAREALTHFATCPQGKEWRMTGKQPLICTLGEDLDESARQAAALQLLRERYANGAA